MKLTNLIEELIRAFNKHGDIEVTSEPVHYLMIKELKDNGEIIVEDDVLVRKMSAGEEV